MPAQFHDPIRNDLYPGNGEVFESLRSYLKAGGLTLLTGAGVSAPLFPTWTPFLKAQLTDAKAKGLVSQAELVDYERLLSSDLLEVAEAIEQLFGRPVFRARLADTFRNADAQCTESHRLIQQLSLRGVVTLNYDNGHEVAYSSSGMHPNVGKAKDIATLTRWTQDDVFSDKNLPILHFHGDVSSPDQMVLTSTDYDHFYRQELPTTLLKQLWRSHRLLVVGFGFTDPFLIRVADGALRDLPADVRHFAIIGRHEGQSFSPIERRTFARKFRLTPRVYEVTGQNGDDHSNLHRLNERLLKEVIGLRSFSRIVVLVRQNLFEATETFPVSQYGIEFQWLSLLSLNRADVRSLTSQFYDTNDSDTVSAIVDKVYSDLIALCIPITPSNVVIYLEVIYKDGDFQPVNRVHIVNRYLSNSLTAPSDAFRDSFTSKNKLDVLSAFVFDAYQRDKRGLSEADWFAFCKRYKDDSLVQFDERQLLDQLSWRGLEDI